MKILHTSDLHIGKRLYQAELAEEQLLFFTWMTDLIKREQIDALLISGDVFDVANPSSESRKIYFELLVTLSRLGCKVIIAGGNHDSPAVLEAPKELLKELDIHVTGSIADDIRDILIPVISKDGMQSIVVAAIPYLREADLRKHSENDTSEDRAEAIRKGIIGVFTAAAEECKKQYLDLPAIAMGHLYVQGAGISESEREIQIGNIAGIDASKLPGHFHYYALGHLHKPQDPVSSKIIYSGTPIKMSFSESKNENRVVLLTIEGNITKAESILVPLNRSLLKLSGTVDELREKLQFLPKNTNRLSTFIELDAIEENVNPDKILELEALISNFKNDSTEILKYRIRFINQPTGTADLYDINVNIEDLKPIDVFNKKIENENLDDATSKMLKEAFAELLEEVQQKEEEK